MASALCALAPDSLRCEYQEDPGQVDAPRPRLSWVDRPAPGAAGLAQSAYEILVASSAEALAADAGDLWSSGRVASDASHLVPYGGRGLVSGETCHWKVRVWDGAGNVSAWSRPARWTMGMLAPTDWKCRWIGAPWQDERPSKYSGDWPAAPLLRRAFQVKGPVRAAHFFGTGLGYFELYVNGRKVGDDVLSPNQTNYGRRPALPVCSIPLADNFAEYRVLYVGYDVAPLLREGENAVGAILGNGFYNTDCHWDEPYGSPRFFGQIVIDYADGTREVVASDAAWRAARSAIVANDVFRGEHYDARLEHDGWSEPGYDDSAWEPASLRAAPAGRLVAQNGPADRVCETFRPDAIVRQDDGSWRVSFPVEISGWLHLSGIRAAAGTKLSVTYVSESPMGGNSYICRGTGDEDYHARFTWFVFREAVVSGWEGELTAANVVAEAVNSAVARTGRFRCSNALFEKLNEAFVRSQLDNMHGSIASDCPHRERTPYTGDGALACASALANLDTGAFYNKWIADIRGAANPDTGHVPNSAPWQPGAGGGVAWGAAIAIIPWEFYLAYGDDRVLTGNLDAMVGYVRFLSRWAPDFILEKKDPTSPWQNLGDWIWPFQEIPRAIVHTWHYWRCADIARRAAALAGRPREEREMADLAKNVRDAFHARFYDGAAGSYGAYGANVFALAMGVPEERRERVVRALARNIADARGHTDCGAVASAQLFTTLAKNGLTDLAFQIMAQEDEPSFGNWIRQGATTLWEYWDGAHSHNHPFFGGGFVWFYRDVAGLAPDPEGPGYRHILVEPKIPAKLESVSYALETPYGLASVAWRRAGEGIVLDVVVPVGSTATVRLNGLVRELGQGTHRLSAGRPTQDAE